jgi:alpha-D-ribose 1-methylphosphonate 5-triphosphate diphosphatase PhnM
MSKLEKNHMPHRVRSFPIRALLAAIVHQREASATTKSTCFVQDSKQICKLYGHYETQHVHAFGRHCMHVIMATTARKGASSHHGAHQRYELYHDATLPLIEALEEKASARWINQKLL